MIPRSLVNEALTLLAAGALPDAAGAPCAQVRYDSRRVEPGDLFVALPGERTDGHLHLRDAVERGAAGAVVRPEAVPTDVTLHGVAVYPVTDTLKALQRIAAAWRASLT